MRWSSGDGYLNSVALSEKLAGHRTRDLSCETQKHSCLTGISRRLAPLLKQRPSAASLGLSMSAPMGPLGYIL
jgi:hypothetical protein